MNDKNIHNEIDPNLNEEKIVFGFFNTYKDTVLPNRENFRKFVMEKLGRVESPKEVTVIASPYQIFIQRTTVFSRGLVFAVVVLLIAQASFTNKNAQNSDIAQVNTLQEEQISLALERIDTTATKEVAKTPYTESPIPLKATAKVAEAPTASTMSTEGEEEITTKNTEEVAKGEELIDPKTKEPLAKVEAETKSDVETIIESSYEENL